jgi:hypothetical protein
MTELEDLYRQALLDDDEATIAQLAPIIDRTPPPRLLAAALAYAAWGWPVFPCIPGAKAPATRSGFKDATTDERQIQAWWRQTPNANIGLPTGHHFDVIDIDAPKGWRNYWRMQDEGLLPPIHGLVSTAGYGLHLYVTPTGGGNGAGWLPGIDYRGVGGYVIAPPSVTDNGSNYMWRDHPTNQNKGTP